MLLKLYILTKVTTHPNGEKEGGKGKSKTSEWNGGEDWNMAESGFFDADGEGDWPAYDDDEQAILDQLTALRTARAGGKSSSSAIPPDVQMDWQSALL